MPEIIIGVGGVGSPENIKVKIAEQMAANKRQSTDFIIIDAEDSSAVIPLKALKPSD